MVDVTILKVSDKIGETMYPELHKLQTEFDKKLKALVKEHFDKNRGNAKLAYESIMPTLLICLVNMMKVGNISPLEALRVFSETLKMVYISDREDA
jgi:hypothetical protein